MVEMTPPGLEDERSPYVEHERGLAGPWACVCSGSKCSRGMEDGGSD